MRRALFILVLIIGYIQSPAEGHQPRLVTGDAVRISNPEISQAFYASLDGRPQVYSIHSDKPLHLYVQITVPDAPGARRDFRADISRNGRSSVHLDGSRFDWKRFHEPFTNDDYLLGPQVDVADSAPGDYTITVTSSDNTGKYVLVVGTTESFPPGEALGTLLILPRIKVFMGRSAFTAYFNLSGLFLLLLLLLTAGLAVLAVFVVRRVRRAARRRV